MLRKKRATNYQRIVIAIISIVCCDYSEMTIPTIKYFAANMTISVMREQTVLNEHTVSGCLHSITISQKANISTSITLCKIDNAKKRLKISSLEINKYETKFIK
jgi:hypothetical protein